MTPSSLPSDGLGSKDSPPTVGEPVTDDNIYRDGSYVVVPLSGLEGFSARFPRPCIKCGAEQQLQGVSAPLTSQWRTPGRPIPVVQARFCVCRKHARVTHTWQGVGCAMLIAWFILLVMIVSGVFAGAYWKSMA